MQFSEVVRLRQSVRVYTPEPVSEPQLTQLLCWAANAPSAGALHPLEFILLEDSQQREAVVAATFCGVQEQDPHPQAWLLSAPILIVVCGDLQKVERKYGTTSLDAKAMLSQDCGAAIENFLLGAVSLGLSSCYVSGFRTEQLSKALHLPPHILPMALLPLGYRAGEQQQRPLRSAVLHKNTYGTGKTLPK